jgi:valyl-tRNA synthetase
MTAGLEAAPDLAKPYDPHAVELPARWYAFWEKHGVFAASDAASDTRPAYVVPMPPPNVTGSLHMGHALMTTLEDVLVRWRRMRGFNVLWQPGIDHAGIATQTVVERQLAREKTTRHELGREAFVARVWKWKGESGGRISQQQRELGASPDWPRTKFTMDADLNVAVTEAFVRLHEEGHIYRATRLINWCPDCRTALSDLEVENEEGAQGEMFEFAYKVDGESERSSDRSTPGAGDGESAGEIVVATTRPETMLGDTAVAVHPDDPRYKHLHGKMLTHPFVDRKIPVITDAILVDPKFGTGAVKITPAHDFNDFATGKRHSLPEISIFTLDGKVNENGGPRFQGLDRKKARTEVKKALDEIGLARGSKPHVLNIPRCQRSNTIVEPMISTQWFCAMKGMADKAIAAVRSGETKILPEEWQKTYDHFLENIQDWCVSRQLWWGHQIPAWHGPDGQIKVARERPAECGPEWTQDPDVLDTWFSSALWPFSTLGWPAKTPALAKFYNPINRDERGGAESGADLETGYDILFFWVARMMMFGIHFMGRAPFARILLHGLVVDETGDKMSKVKGNVIDPLDLIHGSDFKTVVDKALPGAPEAEALAKFKKAYPSVVQMGTGFPAFGADALRYTLVTYPPSNKRIALAPKRIEGYRHFVNKIWNATRLSLDLLGPGYAVDTSKPPSAEDPYNRWILSRLSSALVVVEGGFKEFRIDEAANELYRFFWNDFCDWYLEIAKTVLRDADGSVPIVVETRAVLGHVLETTLRALHPMMPFATEELWQRLTKSGTKAATVALAHYPERHQAHIDVEIEKKVATLQAVIGAARTIRSEHEVHPAAEVPLQVRTDDETTRGWLASAAPVIRFLVKTKGAPVFERTGGPREPGTTVGVVPLEAGAVQVLVGLKGIVTPEGEAARIERSLKSTDKEIAQLDKKLTAKGFVDRAPKEVVDETKAQLKAMKDARARLEEEKALIEELRK